MWDQLINEGLYKLHSVEPLSFNYFFITSANMPVCHSREIGPHPYLYRDQHIALTYSAIANNYPFEQHMRDAVGEKKVKKKESHMPMIPVHTEIPDPNGSTAPEWPDYIGFHTLKCRFGPMKPAKKADQAGYDTDNRGNIKIKR